MYYNYRLVVKLAKRSRINRLIPCKVLRVTYNVHKCKFASGKSVVVAVRTPFHLLLYILILVFGSSSYKIYIIIILHALIMIIYI